MVRGIKVKKLMSVIFLSILLAFSFSIGGLSKTCMAASGSSMLYSLAGEYDGTYSYSGGRVGMRLIVYTDSYGNYKASLNTFRLSDRMPVGFYDLNAHYNINARRYELSGNKVSNSSSPSNYVTLRGTLSRGIFSGYMDSSNGSFYFSLTKLYNRYYDDVNFDNWNYGIPVTVPFNEPGPIPVVPVTPAN